MILGLILMQALYYAIAMGFVVLIFGGLQRGFLFKYIKVRTSFGRLFLIKFRTQLRDYFEIGWIDEGFIVYKHNKQELRIALDNGRYFYKCMAVNWIDVNEENKNICTIDYNEKPSYDASKFSDLLTRALMRPAIESGKEKIMFVLMIVMFIAILGAILLCYINYTANESIYRVTQQVFNAVIKG